MSKHVIWALLISVVSLVGCHDEEFTFDVTLSGAQQVPPVETMATASGAVTLLVEKGDEEHFVTLTSTTNKNPPQKHEHKYKHKDDDPDPDPGPGEGDTYTLSAEVDVSNVDNVVSVHIHEGSIGTNGPVAFEFTDNGDGTMSVESTEITMEQADMLMNGEWYLNVHTQQNPPGELRGQIVDANTEILAFVLDGNQEVPAVDTDASGLGYATLNTESYELDLKVITTGVDDAEAAHIHEGEIGTNGGVAVFLEQNAEDPTVWQTPEDTTLEADVANTLLAGGHYVNVHTPGVPSGEIRGQIVNEMVKIFAFGLSGDEEVPPVVTDGSGDGYVWFDRSTSVLSVLVITSGLEGASAAHVHEGEVGANGGVVVGLVQDGSDVNVWRSPDNVTLDEDTANTLLAGGHYINVHTPEVPSGEVRGQID
ncbi:CHRD domain-containing protein [Photobacterium sanctipauli]|uniref:CHRD domain-containing protein n=1 Tax=Photobacterium sanctipauli TaxID=1342794 RepID=A0A2T3NWX0_9GAMM|nr:CHRD domain-containing protein [Photobacterium sanctipauli]PSW20765.1 CHRD domain-containing protein [Photobacterium sanctipauli]